MKHRLPTIILALTATLALPAFAHDDNKPLTLNLDPKLQRELNPGAFAHQWITAFEELRTSSLVQAELILANDGIEYTIEDVQKLEKAGKSNLLLITYRENRRDFKAIIAPEQIRMIRQIIAETP